jgi:predicted XRE-type DNA-binding protein
MSNGRRGHVTTGNVLDDLGFDEKEALELKLKSEIHAGIIELIEAKGYTPKDLERILGVKQTRVSELQRGKLATMGIRKLLWYAKLLGADTNVKVRAKRAA